MDFDINHTINVTDVCTRADSVQFNSITIEETVINSVLLVCALLTAVAGSTLIRPVSCLVGVVTGFGLGFVIVAREASCETRLAVSGAMGVACAALALCVLQIAILLMGGLVGGVVANEIFNAWPDLETLVDSPSIWGRSVFYWGTIFGSAIVSGVAAKCYGKKTLAVLTSVFGGAGVTYCMTTFRDGSTWTWVSLGVGASTAIGGFLVQRRVRRRSRKPVKEDHV